MPRPAVSIVVPTRNRLASLQSAVGALQRQRGPGALEIVVVDDASRDGTDAFLAKLAAAGAIVHVRGRGRGAAAARNAGIRQARSEFLAFTDDDCEVPADWAFRMRGRLAETGAAAVGGRVVTVPEAGPPARLSQAITNAIASAVNREGIELPFLTSNNVAYRADALHAAGLFDEGFAGAGGEDRDLHARLRAKGGRLVYAPDIVVSHRPPADWAAFLRQQVAYGRGARRYYRGRRENLPRPRPLSLRQYVRAFGSVIAEARPEDRAAFAFGLPLSQAAVAWGYLSGSGA